MGLVVGTALDPFVLCHGDLHAGKLLLGAQANMTIVDWDSMLLEPVERDLMFVGAGVGGVWNAPDEAEQFYQGYGHRHVDAVLCYYRYERIPVDIAEFHDFILGRQANDEERVQAMYCMAGQFTPGNVVQCADEAYDALHKPG